jgi:hypothetical protein
MSIWYVYVNLDKKEYLNSLDIGYSLKEWPYVSTLLPLIGFLHIGSHNSGECDGDHKPESDDDYVLMGHWAGDKCELIMEQTPVYDEIQEWEKKEGGPWTNISHQVLKEYNKNLDELSGFWLDDEEKNKLSIPVGPFGEHNKH